MQKQYMQMGACLDRVLYDADLKKQDIQAVVLEGGASLTYGFATWVKENICL